MRPRCYSNFYWINFDRLDTRTGRENRREKTVERRRTAVPYKNLPYRAVAVVMIFFAVERLKIWEFLDKFLPKI